MALLLRKYGKTAAMAAASYVGDSRLFLLDYLLRILRVALLLSVWRTLFAGRGEVGGMGLSTVLTYTLVAEAFTEPLNCQTDLPWAFWDGSIVMRFLKPMGVIPQYAAEALGKWALGFCIFSLPLLLLAPLVGVDPLPASPSAGLWFAVSLALAVSVGFALEAALVAMAIYLEFPAFAVDRVRSALSVLLSGAFLPLALMPWNLGKLFGWLPFASTASAPMRIYTGTGDTFWLMCVQAGWSVVLWPIAIWLWRINRERMVSYGG